MATLPWGEWKPDVTAFGAQHSPTITGVVPRGDGYGPFKSLAGLSDALAATCRGYYTALDDDGTISIFAGASQELYKMSNSNFSWDTVSAATYTALGAAQQWQFAQYGTRVLAVNPNANPQSYVMGSSTDFADLGGATSNDCSHVTIVGDFVVLSGITADPFTVAWSAIADPTGWTPGTNQSDTQTFNDGGMVRGVAGGEYGLVFQDYCIRRMTYAPGSPVIFEFDRVSDDMGLLYPYSIIRSRDMVFFISNVGFQMWHPTVGFKPIGKERVDRTFFEDVDSNSKQLIIGSNDHSGSRVCWAYKSVGGNSGLIDTLLIYDWGLDRWSKITGLSGEYLAPLGIPGITLDSLDNINTSIDALVTPLDDYSTGFGLHLGMANSSNVLGTFSGTNVEAIMETADMQQEQKKRSFVRGARPITDAQTVYGSVSRLRQKVNEAPAMSTEMAMNVVGFTPHRIDSRLVRFRNRIPAGEAWTFSAGVEPDMVTSGRR
jgi:hypothetical protein